MQYAKKMSLVPYQTGEGNESQPTNEFISSNPSTDVSQNPQTKKKNSIREYAKTRMESIFNVVLKLAQHGLYDSSGKFKMSNGDDQEIIPLLLHCFSPGRTIRGLDHFVRLLHKAGVDPNTITNPNVEELLMHIGSSGSFENSAKRNKITATPSLPTTPPPSTIANEPKSPASMSPSVKRKRDDDTEETGNGDDLPPSKVFKRKSPDDWDDNDSDDE